MKVTNQISAPSQKIALRKLIEQYRYGRYCEDMTLPIERARRLLVSEVQDYLGRIGNQALAVILPTGEMLGLLLFRLSQWDTDHFGYPVAIVDSLYTSDLGYEKEFEVAGVLLRHFDEWCRSSGIRFISARVPSIHLPIVHSFEQNGFRYIETWIYNKFDLHRLDDVQKTMPTLRKANPSDVELMLEYSKDAFSTQRFYADPRIELDKADSLYRKWILTSVADPQQEILVMDKDSKPAAFMIYYRKDMRDYFGSRFAMWKMAVLDPNNRGKGVGTDFFLALMYQHLKEDLDIVDSGLTMRNLASLNLHNKLGFKIVASVITFHKWVD